MRKAELLRAMLGPLGDTIALMSGPLPLLRVLHLNNEKGYKAPYFEPIIARSLYPPSLILQANLQARFSFNHGRCAAAHPNWTLIQGNLVRGRKRSRNSAAYF